MPFLGWGWDGWPDFLSTYKNTHDRLDNSHYAKQSSAIIKMKEDGRLYAELLAHADDVHASG